MFTVVFVLYQTYLHFKNIKMKNSKKQELFNQNVQFMNGQLENKTILDIIKLKYLLYFGVLVAIVFCCTKF